MNTYKVKYKYLDSDLVYHKTLIAPSESEARRILKLMRIPVIISITIK